eukprot:8812820-Pyramimonas_sp.AAC.2
MMPSTTGQDGNDERDRPTKHCRYFCNVYGQLYRRTDSSNGRSTHGCRPPCPFAAKTWRPK